MEQWGDAVVLGTLSHLDASYQEGKRSKKAFTHATCRLETKESSFYFAEANA